MLAQEGNPHTFSLMDNPATLGGEGTARQSQMTLNHHDITGQRSHNGNDMYDTKSAKNVDDLIVIGNISPENRSKKDDFLFRGLRGQAKSIDPRSGSICDDELYGKSEEGNGTPNINPLYEHHSSPPYGPK
eukprot:UN26533